MTSNPLSVEEIADGLPMDLAPRDGTVVRLFVDYGGQESWTPLEDAMQAWTIGSNNFDNDGEDQWRFAGWNWQQDYWCEGFGKPIGWLPFFDAPADIEPQQPKADVEAVGRAFSEMTSLYDESPIGRDCPFPDGQPIDTASWGRGVNAGWDAAIRRCLAILSAVAPAKGEPVEALVAEDLQKAAAEVVVATVQDAEGRWIIAGDGEILISRLADALASAAPVEGEGDAVMVPLTSRMARAQADMDAGLRNALAAQQKEPK